MRATPPAARMSAGTRSSAMTATAPASSAILAWSGVTTSMMTPPLSIWARPFLVAQVDVSTVMWAVDSFGWSALGSPAGSGPGVLARSSRPSPSRAPIMARASHTVPPRGQALAAANVNRVMSFGEHRPGERLDRSSAPRDRPGSSGAALASYTGRLVLRVAARGSARERRTGAATSSRADPSTMTTSSPNSTLTASCGFARRLRCQRVGPPSTYQWPSTHEPQIGIRCGAASVPAVASQ